MFHLKQYVEQLGRVVQKQERGVIGSRVLYFCGLVLEWALSGSPSSAISAFVDAQGSRVHVCIGIVDLAIVVLNASTILYVTP